MFGNISLFMKILYLLPLVPVYGIVYIVVYAFNSQYVFDGHGATFVKVITVPLFEIAAIMTIFCHVKAMITNPGSIEEEKLIKEVEFEAHKNELYCKHCDKKRPERAHHCKTCKRCVLKMDHHCPWISNCVGYYNQKYFIQFLFYATVGNFIAFLCLGAKLLHVDFKFKKDENGEELGYWSLFVGPLLTLAGTVFSVSMTISIGSLLYYQLWLTSYNITTIEKAAHNKVEDNIYYSPDRIHNLKIVLGLDNYFHWFIPVFKPNMYNNGYDYALNRGDQELRLPTSERMSTQEREEEEKKQYNKFSDESNNSVQSSPMSDNIMKKV